MPNRIHKLALLVVFTGLFAQAQEVKHAPTVEQCRADARLWLAKLEDGNVGMSPHSPDYPTLDGWRREMWDCKSVDPDKNQTDYYHDAITEIDAVQGMRLEDFLDRHGLYDKFIAEDKSGKR
jgi:hypothetical protein